MLFEGGFTFRNFVAVAFAIFMFVLWFWLFVSVASDLFRRHDVSGWAKVLWVIALVLFSYIGIFAYVLTQGRGMAERNQARAQQARDELRQVVVDCRRKAWRQASAAPARECRNPASLARGGLCPKRAAMYSASPGATPAGARAAQHALPPTERALAGRAPCRA